MGFIRNVYDNLGYLIEKTGVLDRVQVKPYRLPELVEAEILEAQDDTPLTERVDNSQSPDSGYTMIRQDSRSQIQILLIANFPRGKAVGYTAPANIIDIEELKGRNVDTFA